MVDTARDPSFLHDEEGNKTHVLLPIDVYEELLEDLHDLAVVAELGEEDTLPFDELVSDLKRSGKL